MASYIRRRKFLATLGGAASFGVPPGAREAGHATAHPINPLLTPRPPAACTRRLPAPLLEARPCKGVLDSASNGADNPR